MSSHSPSPTVSAAGSGTVDESEHEVEEKIYTVFDKERVCKTHEPECHDALFWGPYLSERQWGTVREDYSADDSCWSYTTYESAQSKAFSQGEDGLLGVSDKHGLLCASVALWNERDSMLKERLFGLSGDEGNHGEDVKEMYYYLDNTPDHSYMQALYKYPQTAFPYEAIRDSGHTIDHPEFEIIDTGVFDNYDYWDVFVEYAKPSNPHLVCKYTIINKSTSMATLHIIPQFFFRNTWSKANRRQDHSHERHERHEQGRRHSYDYDSSRRFSFRNRSKIPSILQQSEDNSLDASYEAGSFHITFYHTGNVIFNKLLFTNNESVEDNAETHHHNSVNKGNHASSHEETIAWNNRSNSSSISKPFSRSSISKAFSPAGSSQQVGLQAGEKRPLPPTKPPRSKRQQRADLKGLPSVREMLETNKAIIWKKDAFHRHIIHETKSVLRDEEKDGTKAGAWMTCEVQPQGKACVYWQITPMEHNVKKYNNMKKLDNAIRLQKEKAEDLYSQIIPKGITGDQNNLCRQAIAGLLWSKQFYLYNGEEMINEMHRLHGEQHFFTTQGAKKFQWKHLDCEDILLIPDKWEFPWFASWDLAIQAALYAGLDLNFAKKQIYTLLSDRYMHRNGQIPGCEFNFTDPNPPLMAWAVWKVHQHEKPFHMDFIKTVYPRLLVNYQWWHRMDPTNSHLFGNGFMGLDNISVIDRSQLPRGILTLKQADATGWMGVFALTMLQLSLKQCQYDLCLTDMAIRFLKDFLAIAKAINANTENGGLWHADDGFYYDQAHLGRHHDEPVRVRSWTGLIPLFACGRVNLQHAPGVKAFLMGCDKSFAPYVSKLSSDEFFFTLVPYTKLKSVLNRALSEKEFLSPFGIRSVSKLYNTIPLNFEVKGQTYTMTYQPGESNTKMFGGNSNWRGPVWLCLNYMFVECLEKYAELSQIFTLPLKIDYPSGSQGAGSRKTFSIIVEDLCGRITSIFTPSVDGARPVHEGQDVYCMDNDWRQLCLFYEYFHADTGRGCGASHQTGWSALYVEFIKKLYEHKMSRAAKKK